MPNKPRLMCTTLQEVRDVIEDDEWPQEMTYTEYTVGEEGQVVATEKP